MIPNPEVLLAQIATFAIGMVAVWFIYLKPLGQHLKERKAGIVKDLSAAEQARAEAEKLRSEFAQEKIRMADENRRLIEKNKADAERFRAELMAEAKKEHDALLKAGRAQIKREGDEATRKIRTEAASLVVEATEKLLKKNLNSTTQAALARKFVDAVKAPGH